MDVAGLDARAYPVVGADVGDGGAGRAACGAPEEVGVAERARRVALVGGVEASRSTSCRRGRRRPSASTAQFLNAIVERTPFPVKATQVNGGLRVP